MVAPTNCLPGFPHANKKHVSVVVVVLILLVATFAGLYCYEKWQDRPGGPGECSCCVITFSLSLTERVTVVQGENEENYTFEEVFEMAGFDEDAMVLGISMSWLSLSAETYEEVEEIYEAEEYEGLVGFSELVFEEVVIVCDNQEAGVYGSEGIFNETHSLEVLGPAVPYAVNIVILNGTNEVVSLTFVPEWIYEDPDILSLPLYIVTGGFINDAYVGCNGDLAFCFTGVTMGLDLGGNPEEVELDAGDDMTYDVINWYAVAAY